MSATKATPFTVRDQLERDAKRAINETIQAFLREYRPYADLHPTLHISRAAHNVVGDVEVRVRVEIAGVGAPSGEWVVETA